MKTLSHKRSVLLLFCLLALFFTSKNLSAQLVFNEMMSSNTSTLEDQYNEFPDWIEIYNNSGSSVDLSTYYLSDDSTNLNKWNFPAMNLPLDTYMLVFASGRDVPAQPSYWHTVVNTGENWKYLLPESQEADSWKSSSSHTSSWQEGPSGIGYSDNDDNTTIASTLTVLMQKSFNIENLEQVTDAALFIDYDDGFVAYLNGTEIARSSNMGTPGSPVNFDQTASFDREAIMYSGQDPEAYYISDQLGLLKEGENILAVEIHNVGPTSSDMSGIPFFLMGFSAIQEDLIYKNPYFTVKDKYPHANFKIQSAGEQIYLSDAQGNIIDHIAKIQLPTDFSYARIPGNPDEYAYYEYPSPGEENGTEYAVDYITDSVILISNNQDFDPMQRVRMESAAGGGEIHYTTDGSDPDSSDPIFSSVLDLDSTTVIKARIYKENSLPGPVTTKTFFTGNDHDLPIISVSMDPYDLFDYNHGIYVMGPNAEAENPHMGANFWQDWERPGHFELFNENNEKVFDHNAGIKIFGGWSRAHDQRSMSFFARKSYGDGTFDYPLFKERSLDKYEAFVLRNDGNDWCNGMFRDAVSAYMSAEMNIDHQAYQPYVMYLNGQYWGIINMREKINEHFLASNHQLHPEDVNIVEGNNWVVHGSNQQFTELYNFVTTNDMSVPENYEIASEMMDMGNFISFQVLNIFVDNKDWPGNNNKFWVSNGPGSKFRWISFDTDFGYSIWDHTAYTINTLQFALSETAELNWANQLWATAILRSLLANNEFKNSFINEFADRMNTTFQPDHMIPVVDSFELRLDSEAPAHYDRWIGDPNNWLSYPNWLNSVERIRTYFRQRPQYMQQHIRNRFGISGMATLRMNISEPGAGYVKINNVDLKSFPFSGSYFNNIPVRLEAIPAPGYAFSHWGGNINTDTTVITVDPYGEKDYVAIFVELDSAVNLVINEINYTSSPDKNTGDWVEIYNNSGVSVDLKGWSIMDGFSQDTFYIKGESVMPANSYAIFSRSVPDFKMYYPESQPLKGDLPFGFDDVKDGVALIDPDGAIHDYVIYESISPWPAIINGSGQSLELINPKLDNALAGSWKASEAEFGTPFMINSTYKDTTVIVNKIEKEEIKLLAYPSPFKEKMFISGNLEVNKIQDVSIWSSNGSLIKHLTGANLEGPMLNLEWKPQPGTPAGLYFIRIQTTESNHTLKVLYE